MNMNGAQIDEFIVSVVGKYFFSEVKIDAELRSLLSCGNIGVRLVCDVGVDSQGGFWRRFGFEFFCEADEVLCFLFGFDVKISDAGVECFDDFGIGFADASEDGFLGVATGLEGAEEFAAADNIKAGAGLCHKSEDMDVAAGLDGKADCGVDLAVGLFYPFKVFEEGGLAVDVGGRAEPTGDFFDSDVLGE